MFDYLLVNVGEDCPVFDGLYEFCQLSTGGSIGLCCRSFSVKVSFLQNASLICVVFRFERCLLFCNTNACICPK